MNKKVIVLLLVLSLVLVVGCSKKDKSPDQEQNTEALQKNEQTVKQQKAGEIKNEKILNPRDLERYNGEGDIQMGVIFANPLGQGEKGYLTFVVQMDNHSYDLNEYDLSKYATVVDDKGNSPEGEARWQVYSGGGHHVINYLLFPDNGFIKPNTQYIKLVIKDFIDLPLREFIWEKEYLGIKE